MGTGLGFVKGAAHVEIGAVKIEIACFLKRVLAIGMHYSKKVVVTGANKGIGLGLSKALAQQGHEVLMTGRNTTSLQEAAKGITGSVYTHLLDVQSTESIEAFSRFVQNEWGPFHVLVNNAAVLLEPLMHPGDPQKPLRATLEEVETTWRTNVLGPYALIQTLYPSLVRDVRADIINVSSGAGALTHMGPGYVSYRMSKSALNALTRTLAQEVKGTQIYVNSVCPGWVRTDMGTDQATRSIEEGLAGMLWIINEEPKLSGAFLRDKTELDW